MAYNILVLNYEYPPVGGGGAAVCKDICELAVKAGHNITIVTMGYKALPLQETINGVNVHRVKCLRSSQRVCHPWEQLSYCISAYKYITKNLDTKSFDFIHCHFIIPTGLLALWLNRKYGIKYIITAHGSDVIGHNNSRFALLYKFIKPWWINILKNAFAVTAPSQYLVNKIKESYDDIKVTMIPNGVHLEKYTSMPKEKYILVLSRLQESKGIQDLIDVCTGLDMNGWVINILGDGPYRKTLEELVDSKGLKDIVFFKGHVDGTEKFDYLSKAGCFFSGSKFESFALSVLEATVCKCNTIVSRIEPHLLLVGEKHTYKDRQELAVKIKEIINTYPTAIDYGNDNYNWSEIYKKYLDVYRKIS